MSQRPTVLHLLAIAVLAGLVGGCAGGQSGSEGPVGVVSSPATDAGLSGCVDATRTDVGRDQQTPLGFTPQQMLNLALGTHRATMNFEPSTQPGDTTGLTVTVTDTGATAQFVDAQSGAATPGAGCPDYAVITMQLRLTTDDGRFDETFSARLVGFQASEAAAIVERDADALTGAFDYASADPAAYESRVVIFNATFNTDATTGRVSGTGTRADGTSQTVTISQWGDTPAGDTQ